MKTVVKLAILAAIGFCVWKYNLGWYFTKKVKYEIYAKEVPKDTHYIRNYLVLSCSGPYCNYTHEWQGGGVAGYEVSKTAESGTGTATAIDNQGHWLTARHVVDGCKKIRLRTGPGEEIYVRKARLHPKKDLALLYTEAVDVPYLKIARKSPPQHSMGYVSGFPLGHGGILYMNLLGSNKYRHALADTIEYTFIWSRESGLDAHRGELFGFSGSSIISRQGEIISVMQGYSRAYAQSIATATSTLASVHELTSDIPGLEKGRAGAMDLKLTDDNFFRVGTKLREQYSVVMVHCEA